MSLGGTQGVVMCVGIEDCGRRRGVGRSGRAPGQSLDTNMEASEKWGRACLCTGRTLACPLLSTASYDLSQLTKHPGRKYGFFAGSESGFTVNPALKCQQGGGLNLRPGEREIGRTDNLSSCIHESLLGDLLYRGENPPLSPNLFF